MKTRTQIHLAIGLGVMSLALLWPIHNLEAKPLVECKNGKCVIDEADWEKYREFAKAQRLAMEAMQEEGARNTRTFMALMGELAKCQSRLPQKEV
jgi:hypothetical protein